MISLCGVILAVILLVCLIYRRISLIPATLICGILLVLTSKIPYIDLVMDHYATAMSGFIAKYFFVFVSNALFGKIMEETLLVAVFSKMIKIGRAHV